MANSTILYAPKPSTGTTLYIVNNGQTPDIKNLSKEQSDFIALQIKNNNSFYYFPLAKELVLVAPITPNKKSLHLTNEACRNAGNKICSLLNRMKQTSVQVVNQSSIENAQLPVAEGIALSNYQFIKYFKDAKAKKNSLEKITVCGAAAIKNEVLHLQIIANSLYQVRDMVNEPVLSLNSVDLGKLVLKAAKTYGFKAEVWNKKKIAANQFGGLLAVNMGSVVEPTFSILEWKPANAKNKAPIVLVGKGVTYDTGGLSIKPTPDSMDHMKCDMSGAASVLGTFMAIAEAKLNLHVIGLIPSTDNRINGAEYTPGDIIKMHNGMFVEVLNTDAEGRMILADALSYANKYKPELVVDIATLTGAAARAIGPWGHAIMGNASEEVMKEFKNAGDEVHERTVELPFWDDYADKMRSSIADLKNVGGADGGAMTAGKFLEFFTDYPYVHNDIAGCSFTNSSMSYRGKGGTGYGMRFLFRFLKNRALATK
jgi:leucyl aminopeptidase